MTPEQLRASILQYAIQGKLVNQRPEEGTAEELYQQIQEEKQRLIKEGMLKKTRALSAITDDEVPYDFPETWKICYIDDIAFVTKLAGFEYTKYIADNLVTEGIPLFKGKNVQNGKLVLEFESYIPESISDELPRSQITKKCLLTPYVGTIGNIAIFDGSFKAHLGSNVGKIEILNGEDKTFVTEEYLLWYLKSPYGYSELTKYKKATAQESISIDAIRNVIIAIPPLKEQYRIVSKIEELLPYVERYAKAYEKLEKFNAMFPVDMKKSILQYAIQGKLVEQRPEEGTAEVLYQQIQEEKQKLIKEGKIKKAKPLEDITEDEIPFDIPDSWKWVKLGDVVSLLSGSDFPPSKYNDKGIGTPYMTGASNIENKHLIINRWTEIPNNISNKGDLLLVCKGSGYGKTVMNDVGLVHIARQFMAFQAGLSLDYDYLNYFLQSQILKIKKNGQGVIPGIDRTFVLSMPMPLPPLEEQHRIVAKIEELLPYCDQLVR